MSCPIRAPRDESLEEIEPTPVGRPEKNHDGADTNYRTRKKGAKKAGLSELQMHTALRVAAVPDDKFEAMVEADKPPKVTAVANEGTRKRLDPDFWLRTQIAYIGASAHGQRERPGSSQRDDAASASAIIGK